MSKAWIDKALIDNAWIGVLKKHFSPRIGHAIEDAGHAIDNLALRVHLTHWHPISTAPFNQDLELRVVEAGTILTLTFPCRQTNAGGWINVDLGSPVEIRPVEWRVWQRNQSPHPYHSPVRMNDRSALTHTHGPGAKRKSD